MESQHLTLRRFNQILLALLLLFGLLYLGKGFLVPVAIGGLLAMLLDPVCLKLEKWGLPTTVAAILCVLVLVVLLVAMFSVLIDQLVQLANDLTALDARLNALLDEIHRFVKRTMDVSRERQNEYIRQSLRNALQFTGIYIRSILLFAGSIFVSFTIVMIYTLLFLLYRRRLKNFVIQLANSYNTDARKLMDKITTVASSYIAGVFLVVLILTIINTLGLMIIGIEHALFFGLLAGILNIIPYIGSLTGSLIPVVFALLTKESLLVPLVVALFFLVVQQIESYFLTPNITGGKIKLNPMVTLMALLLGGFVWDVAGMILFIPFLGIAKVIFDNINHLKPYGYVLGKDDEQHKLKHRVFKPGKRNRH
ncbi:AI-2E family transporter [Pontibacter cellulosilyticus]|uniref:AI-2E family transporter n=1 Tax=Pontibacter cellulosilyticus TaxID=1720253 RepID=A0A923NB54_9BACT|nr:AI-2E family transporter [Pontibacter cellulosilyticus]MBC5994681.1 AI-2E family transporter [Pontibacter cellulosilyticus]